MELDITGNAGCVTSGCMRAVHARHMCRACYDKWLKLANPAYKSRQAENKGRWVRENRERNNTTERRRARHRDPAKQRDAMLRQKYGLSLQAYDGMLAAQKGVCALCLSPPVAGRVLHVDHCHKTRQIRGLLCCHCNWYLGRIDRDPALIDRLVAYRREH